MSPYSSSGQFESFAEAKVTNRSKIILIGEFRFPEGDAAAVRNMSLARMCRDLCYEVHVIGKGEARSVDYDHKKKGYFVEGIQYSTMNPAPVSMRERFLHPVKRIRLFETTLKSLALENTSAIIINASDSARHVPMVMNLCRQKSIPLICDLCEWYDPCQFRRGRLDPAYWIFRFVFHRSFPKARNFIVISKLLERRFKSESRNLIRIPPPIDVRTISEVDNTPQDRLVLLYAGDAGKKDLLSEIIHALGSLTPAERSRIEFRLLGPTEQGLRVLLGKSAHLLDEMRGMIKAVGRVPRSSVLVALQQSHFTILLRPTKRYAQAGYPSKVPESLAAGTPIITNFTSDLEDCLGDQKAAIRVDGCSIPEVAQAIRRALSLSADELREMRKNARDKTLQFFDYRLHLNSFNNFLQQLKS